MTKKMLIILMILSFGKLYCVEYDKVKGIKWVEGIGETIVKKGENLQEKTNNAYSTAKLKAVSRVYPFNIYGNGMKSKIMQRYIMERVNINIVKELSADWERDVIEEGVVKYRINLKLGIKDRGESLNSSSELKLLCNKENYVENERMKFKCFSSEKGYVALFVFYDNGAVQRIGFGDSNHKGEIKSDRESDGLGEWGAYEVLIPEESGKEQLLYAVYTKSYFDTYVKYKDGKMSIEELAKEIENLNGYSESAVMYTVERLNIR